MQVPPQTTRHVLLTLNIGKLPPTTYKTTATRWYDVPVSGAQSDPLNNGWYKRTEDVTGVIAGGIVGAFVTEIKD